VVACLISFWTKPCCPYPALVCIMITSCANLTQLPVSPQRQISRFVIYFSSAIPREHRFSMRTKQSPNENCHIVQGLAQAKCTNPSPRRWLRRNCDLPSRGTRTRRRNRTSSNCHSSSESKFTWNYGKMPVFDSTYTYMKRRFATPSWDIDAAFAGQRSRRSRRP
jgi:hypothetical protein